MPHYQLKWDRINRENHKSLPKSYTKPFFIYALDNYNMDTKVHYLQNIKDTINKYRTRLTESIKLSTRQCAEQKRGNETKKCALLAQHPSEFHEEIHLTESFRRANKIYCCVQNKFVLFKCSFPYNNISVLAELSRQSKFSIFGFKIGLIVENRWSLYFANVGYIKKWSTDSTPVPQWQILVWVSLKSCDSFFGIQAHLVQLTAVVCALLCQDHGCWI